MNTTPKKYHYVTFFIVTFFCFSFVFGQVHHRVQYAQPEVQFETMTNAENQTFDLVSMANAYQNTDIGAPQLPVYTYRFLIPTQQDVDSIRVLDSSTTLLPDEYMLMPVQAPIPVSAGHTAPEFVDPNPDIYNTNAFFPKNQVQVLDDGFFDGANHIVTVAVYPIQYNPVTKQLRLTTDLRFRLEFTAGNHTNITPNNRTARNQSMYNRILRDMVANPGDVGRYQTVPRGLGKDASATTTSLPVYEYIVITADSLKDDVAGLVSWKIRKGLDAGVVTVEDISNEYSGDLISGIYDEAGKVRQYLSDAYLDGAVWVVLMGDHTIVPIRIGAGGDDPPWHSTSESRIPADLYYSDFNGDWKVDGDNYFGERTHDDVDYNPEIFVGRVPVGSARDIERWVEKLLVYEMDPGKGDASYLTDCFWVEGDEMSSYPSQVTPHVPSSFSHTIWDDTSHPGFPAGSATVSEMGSGDYGVLNVYAHGAANWFRTRDRGDTDPMVWTEDDYCDDSGCSSVSGDGLDDLTNHNNYAVFYSISCDNAAFDDYNNNYPGRSMAEGFTVMYENNGGPHFLGNSRLGYMYSSRVLNEAFWDLLDGDYGSYDQDSGLPYQHLGVAEAVSKTKAGSHYVRLSHNLFGCPETKLWTQSPSTFANVSVTDNTTSLNVNAGVSGADITVTSGDNGADYHLTATNTSSYTFATDIRPLYVTVTKLNYIPYTAVTGGTFTSNEIWMGNLETLETVRFESGGLLEVFEGTRVLMTGYHNLSIKGDASIWAWGTAEDSIHFTSSTGTSPKSWRNMYINGSDDTLTYCNFEYGDWSLKLYGNPSTGQRNYLKNCTFHDNDIALRIEYNDARIVGSTLYDNRHPVVTINNTEVDFKGNHIFSNERDGVYSTSGNVLNLYGNVIEDNGDGGLSTRNGIYTKSSDVVNIGDGYGFNWQGYNTIRNNYQDEIDASYNYPTVRIFYNSIHDNSGYEVDNNSGNSTIFGYFTWWGERNPDMSQFDGSVSIFDPLQAQPAWEGSPRTSGGFAKVVTQTPTTSPRDQINTLKQTIVDSPNSTEAVNAIRELYGIVRADYKKNEYGERNSFVGFLNQVRSNHPDARVSEWCELYLMYWRMLELNRPAAINSVTPRLAQYADMVKKPALENLVYLHLANNGDVAQARTILRTYTEEYPQDTETIEFLAQSIADVEVMVEENLGFGKDIDPGKEQQITAPLSFQLSPNYPNPFNPSTTISFALPETQNITLIVYDVMGHRVKTLVSGVKEKGNYQVVWNGTDMTGSPVASGVYFYRMQTPQYTQVQKALLIR